MEIKKAVVIGGGGKIGSYLIPMLVQEGYHVVCVSRGISKPFVESDLWGKAEKVLLDRSSENFEENIKSLNADVVVDLICFKDEDMKKLINKLRGSISHYLVCGSVWMHGHSDVVPLLENECRLPLEEYGHQKNLMDETISKEFILGFPGTAVHPGHIVCPGDIPINPQGAKSLDAFNTLKKGQKLVLPNFGMETVHHVHAEDVAGVFLAAIKAGSPSFGQGFHAVSPRAVSLRGYATEAAKWFGKEADLSFTPFDEWSKHVSPKEAEMTLSHILHSPSCSMEKAKRLLGFEPKHTSYEAIQECLRSFHVLE